MIRFLLEREVGVSRSYNRCQEIKNFMSTSIRVNRVPLSSKFCNYACNGFTLLSAYDDGRIAFVDVSDDPIEEKLVFQAHNNMVSDIMWSNDDEYIFTSSGDRTICQWDSKTLQKLNTFSKPQLSGIKFIEMSFSNKHIMASGGWGEGIQLWDLRIDSAQTKRNSLIRMPSGSPIKNDSGSGSHNMVSKHYYRSVTGLKFLRSYEHFLVSSYSPANVFCLWDFRICRKPVSVHIKDSQLCLNSPFTSISTDYNGNLIYLSDTNHRIYIYNINDIDEKNVMKFTTNGYESNSFNTRSAVSPDDGFLIVGSSQKEVYLWNLMPPRGMKRKCYVLQGHDACVSVVSWCGHSQDTITTSDDNGIIRVWRINHESERKDRSYSFHKQDVQLESPCIPKHVYVRKERCDKNLSSYMKKEEKIVNI